MGSRLYLFNHSGDRGVDGHGHPALGVGDLLPALDVIPDFYQGLERGAEVLVDGHDDKLYLSQTQDR